MVVGVPEYSVAVEIGVGGVRGGGGMYCWWLCKFAIRQSALERRGEA